MLKFKNYLSKIAVESFEVAIELLDKESQSSEQETQSLE